MLGCSAYHCGEALRLEGPVSSTELFYDLAMKRLDNQFERIDQIDAKIGSTFALAVAMIPIFGGLLLISDSSPSTTATSVYGVAAVAFAVTVFVAAMAYRGGTWDLRPNLDELGEHSKLRDEESVRRWVARQCVISFRSNEPQLRRKGRWAAAAFFLLALDVVLLAIAVIAAAI